MNLKLNLTLLSFVFISTITFLISTIRADETSSVLGTTTSSAKVYDDSNGTLYIEYNNSQDVYSTISSWQSRYPGRTIVSSTVIPTGSTKIFAVIFNYTGR